MDTKKFANYLLENEDYSFEVEEKETKGKKGEEKETEKEEKTEEIEAKKLEKILAKIEKLVASLDEVHAKKFEGVVSEIKGLLGEEEEEEEEEGLKESVELSPKLKTHISNVSEQIENLESLVEDFERLDLSGKAKQEVERLDNITHGVKSSFGGLTRYLSQN